MVYGLREKYGDRNWYVRVRVLSFLMENSYYYKVVYLGMGKKDVFLVFSVKLKGVCCLIG